jgi:hypothetical protein
MTTADPKPSPSISYAPASIERARRAIRCAPFQLQLYTTIQTTGVFLGAIAGEAGTNHQYTRSPLPESIAENHLLWLIDVGVLRREVDGQGITDSFRLTPLGRRLTQEWQDNPDRWQQVLAWQDRICNWTNRWLRLPF